MSFPKFSSLPAEIRCAIWEYAVQMTAPRIVYLKHCALPLNEHVFSRVRSNWAVGDPAPADCALIIPEQTLCAFIGEQQLAEMETAVFGNGVSVRDFVGNQGIEPIAVTERDAGAASNTVALSSGTARVEFADFKTRWPAARAEDPGADNDLPGWTPPFSSHRMEDGRVRIEWQDDPCQGPLPLKGFKSTSTIPPILVVCRESFEIASKTYRPAFATLGILPENYIDFNRDTVYFNHESIEDTPVDRNKLQLLNCDYNELRQIKRLAIEPPTHTIQFHLVEGWLARILSVLGNVTHVSLVAEPMVLSGESMTNVVKEFHEALHNRNSDICFIQDLADFYEYFTGRGDDPFYRIFPQIVDPFQIQASRLERRQKRWTRHMDRLRNQAAAARYSRWEIPRIHFGLMCTPALLDSMKDQIVQGNASLDPVSEEEDPLMS